jgi:uncharacterized protein (DUF433 family)
VQNFGFSGQPDLGYDSYKETDDMSTTTVIDWSLCPALESVPDKMGGAWVFRGTRVPVSAILQNLSQFSIEELLQEFPTVRREQITAVLDFIAQSSQPQT